jgi:putative hemolysin
MEIVIITILIVLNGIFAMSEIALVSSRKTRLQEMASDGNENAKKALELAKSPNHFLSTVQVGITLVATVTGAFGGSTIAEGLDKFLKVVPVIGYVSAPLSFLIVVALITYFSLIVGELVPKRLAMSNPELIACYMAPSMTYISKATYPLINILSISTDTVLRLMQLKPRQTPTVTEEEIRVMMKEGTRAGIFQKVEKDIVERVLRLNDRKVSTLMNEIIWFEVNTPLNVIKDVITKSPYSHYPICKENLDTVIGIVNNRELLRDYLIDGKMDIMKSVQKPIYVPESMGALKVIETFKKSSMHVALVVDEYGSVKGIVSLNDILKAIVGEIQSSDDSEDPMVVRRSDGTLLLDGKLDIGEIHDLLDIKTFPGEDSGNFQTLGGFVMTHLAKIPVSGDKFDLDGTIFEVVDMDGNRVDKVLVTLKKDKLEIKPLIKRKRIKDESKDIEETPIVN